MKKGQVLWSKEELFLVINLYCKLSFGKMHKRNPSIIEFSNLIGRTPSSVALKFGNFASFDPTLKERGIRGASNASKLDREIWDEFYFNWDEALIESEKLLAVKNHSTIEELNEIDFSFFPEEGIDKERLIKTRVNQAIFRNIILASYNNCCCITGIKNSELLIASHIVPWSVDEKNRLNPMNGVCLNALHDKAFDVGMITISADDYSVIISPKFKFSESPLAIVNYFNAYESKQITLPDKFLPSKEFLKKHNSFFEKRLN
ncbi:MAG TPA: HNH endonuclease [Flavobacteriales bacterium]|nr:HNH endonuclease [Flavobacteriales bacterium]HPH82153.1 HNH endonuclease [Flavobacteriales bacterium]